MLELSNGGLRRRVELRSRRVHANLGTVPVHQTKHERVAADECVTGQGVAVVSEHRGDPHRARRERHMAGLAAALLLEEGAVAPFLIVHLSGPPQSDGTPCTTRRPEPGCRERWALPHRGAAGVRTPSPFHSRRARSSERPAGGRWHIRPRCLRRAWDGRWSRGARWLAHTDRAPSWPSSSLASSRRSRRPRHLQSPGCCDRPDTRSTERTSRCRHERLISSGTLISTGTLSRPDGHSRRRASRPASRTAESKVRRRLVASRGQRHLSKSPPSNQSQSR